MRLDKKKLGRLLSERLDGANSRNAPDVLYIPSIRPATLTSRFRLSPSQPVVLINIAGSSKGRVRGKRSAFGRCDWISGCEQPINETSVR